MIYSPYTSSSGLSCTCFIRTHHPLVFIRTRQCFVLTLWSLWKWSPHPILRNRFDYSLSLLTASCLPWDSLLYKRNRKQAYSFYCYRAKAFSVIMRVAHGEISERGLILARDSPQRWWSLMNLCYKRLIFKFQQVSELRSI